ncbi:MAG: addiction module protein [Capsulimonas sp.]|uniref:addiction module protein n=1 Tax=Capsulimonas sp. TaxID=2494211 RepID=UPI0032636267
MSPIAEQLKVQLSDLPVVDRAAIAHYLLGTLSPLDESDEANLEAVLERRWAQIENGQETGIPAEQVFADLKAKLK